MKKLAAAILIPAMAMLLSACAMIESANKATRVSDTARILEIKLVPSQLVFEDDTRDFQGKGHYYAEFDLSSAAPEFPDNGHWRELPMTEELREFMENEAERFGRSFSEPAHGRWFFMSRNGYREGGVGGETNRFAFGDDYSRTYYTAAFYDYDSGVLTIWIRTW